MPGREEIASSIFGAFVLARLDARGMSFFDISIDGFWRSFFAAAIVAPIYIIIVSLRTLEGAAEVSFAWLFVVEIIHYGFDWVTFPVIMVAIARSMNLSHRYVGYIVAYNWSKVLIAAVWLTLGAIEAIHLLPAALTGGLMLAALAAITYYLWFITCTALRLVWYVGVAIVAIEYLVGLVIDLTAVRILQ